MLRKIIAHHNVDASFLEVPLSFYARMNNEEQSFCVPWTVKEDASSTRKYPASPGSYRIDAFQKCSTLSDTQSTWADARARG
jgi:hypothetical protein